MNVEAWCSFCLSFHAWLWIILPIETLWMIGIFSLARWDVTTSWKWFCKLTIIIFTTYGCPTVLRLSALKCTLHTITRINWVIRLRLIIFKNVSTCKRFFVSTWNSTTTVGVACAKFWWFSIACLCKSIAEQKWSE